MTENLIESIRATVQDFLAPEIRTHTVRLEALDHKIDETKETLTARIDAVAGRVESVAGSVEEAKQTLRADIRTVEVRIQGLEDLIRQLGHQISLEGSIRERLASLEARIPRH